MLTDLEVRLLVREGLRKAKVAYLHVKRIFAVYEDVLHDNVINDGHVISNYMTH